MNNQPMDGAGLLEAFKETGALLEGHFLLRSGLHSAQYFQCALLLQQMPLVERLGSTLAMKFDADIIDTVVAPAMGGLVIGQEVARQLRKRFIFVEKDDNGKLTLRRGFKIATGERILVVEDVITKGGRVQETLDIVRVNGGQVTGIAVVVDRSGGMVSFDVPIQSLGQLHVETLDPCNCSLCEQGLPLHKPGSK